MLNFHCKSALIIIQIKLDCYLNSFIIKTANNQVRKEWWKGGSEGGFHHNAMTEKRNIITLAAVAPVTNT